MSLSNLCIKVFYEVERKRKYIIFEKLEHIKIGLCFPLNGIVQIIALGFKIFSKEKEKDRLSFSANVNI